MKCVLTYGSVNLDVSTRVPLANHRFRGVAEPVLDALRRREAPGLMGTPFVLVAIR
jgi:hypothetical protein